MMYSKKLFHTFNHPTNELIFILFNKILEKLGDKPLNTHEIQYFPHEMLRRVEFPIYKSVQKYFDLDEEVKLVCESEEYPPYKTVEEYYSFYKTVYL